MGDGDSVSGGGPLAAEPDGGASALGTHTLYCTATSVKGGVGEEAVNCVGGDNIGGSSKPSSGEVCYFVCGNLADDGVVGGEELEGGVDEEDIGIFCGYGEATSTM